MRTPSPVRNHPLKSMAQTSLGLCAEAKGSPHAAACRRRFRRRTSPARSSMFPAVLGAGQRTRGSTLRSDATTFFGPHVGWACLAPISRSAIARGVSLG